MRRRVWWKNAAGLATPADEWLNRDGPRVSVGARERCGRIGCHPQGFRRSAEDLQRLAGLAVSAERLRQIVEGEGQQVARRQQAGALTPTWSGPACRVAAGPTSRVYVGVDGFLAPLVTEEEKHKRRAARAAQRRGQCRRRRMRRGHRERYKEFKLLAFYDQAKRRRHVVATGGGPEAVGQLLRRDARRLRLKPVDEVVGIVDGAPWIRNQLERFGGCDHIGLDYYHFSEHVAAAARVCFGEGSPPAAGWRTKVLGLALEVGVDEVLDEVTQQRRELRRPAKREALTRLRNYIAERAAMIRYPQSRARGWDIGSGPTEGLCKTRAARLKGAGMRWDPIGASALLSLSALQDSNAWADYWKLQRAHEN